VYHQTNQQDEMKGIRSRVTGMLIGWIAHFVARGSWDFMGFQDAFLLPTFTPPSHPLFLRKLICRNLSLQYVYMCQMTDLNSAKGCNAHHCSTPLLIIARVVLQYT
jgi:hypothetical protein